MIPRTRRIGIAAVPPFDHFAVGGRRLIGAQRLIESKRNEPRRLFHPDNFVIAAVGLQHGHAAIAGIGRRHPLATRAEPFPRGVWHTFVDRWIDDLNRGARRQPLVGVDVVFEQPRVRRGGKRVKGEILGQFEPHDRRRAGHGGPQAVDGDELGEGVGLDRRARQVVADERHDRRSRGKSAASPHID